MPIDGQLDHGAGGDVRQVGNDQVEVSRGAEQVRTEEFQAGVHAVPDGIAPGYFKGGGGDIQADPGQVGNVHCQGYPDAAGAAAYINKSAGVRLVPQPGKGVFHQQFGLGTGDQGPAVAAQREVMPGEDPRERLLARRIAEDGDAVSLEMAGVVPCPIAGDPLVGFLEFCVVLLKMG